MGPQDWSTPIESDAPPQAPRPASRSRAGARRARRVRTVAFDTTGVRPTVIDVVAFDAPVDAVLAKAAAGERSSSHSLGAAIVEEAERRGIKILRAFRGGISVPGKAVQARLSNIWANVALGSA